MLLTARQIRPDHGLDKGSLAAFDTPLALYDSAGIFRNLCDSSNIQREQILLAKDQMQS